MPQYNIVLRNTTAESAPSPIAGTQGESGTPKKASSDSSSGIKALVVYNKSKPFIKQEIQYRINTVELRTGAAELQQQLQFGYQIASDVFGIGEGILVGAATGGLPGAIAGAVISVVGTVINYAHKQNTINMQETKEDIALSLMDRRAGGELATYNQSRSRSQ